VDLIPPLSSHVGREGRPVCNPRQVRAGNRAILGVGVNYKANVWVWKPPVENDNFIRIQRIGDGNAWPPKDCSLAG